MCCVAPAWVGCLFVALRSRLRRQIIVCGSVVVLVRIVWFRVFFDVFSPCGWRLAFRCWVAVVGVRLCESCLELLREIWWGVV